jgi:hypothetical protein
MTKKIQDILDKAAKRVHFKLVFLHDVPMRRFTMRAGDDSCSEIINNGNYYHGCTADNYISAVRDGKEFFTMDRSPVPVSAVKVVGWLCSRRIYNAR